MLVFNLLALYLFFYLNAQESYRTLVRSETGFSSDIAFGSKMCLHIF